MKKITKLPQNPWFYFGPAFLVSVGYMDPGNWATSLEAGSRFGYQLLWIVTLSSAIAVLMQILSARLGIATGLDLAEHMRRNFPRHTTVFLFGVAFLAMMATDLAEFMGVALALNLLFGLPLHLSVLLTILDVLFILWLERFGFRWVEMTILGFVSLIGGAYVVEIFLSSPDLANVAFHAFVPNTIVFQNTHALFIAIGILGATVMPHNLFLHSAQVKTRLHNNYDERKRIVFWSTLDTASALAAAWLVNGAILVMASAVFHQRGLLVTEIDQAYLTLQPLLGKAAAFTFAIALLASGISSSTTGTLAGQFVVEGFLGLHIEHMAYVRLGIRLLTMAPTLIAVMMAVRPVTLLVLSQVLLSMALPFSVIPLVMFTSNPKIMGPYATPVWMKVLAWLSAVIIVALNVLLILLAL